MNPNGACFDIYQCPACIESMRLRDNPKHLTDAECAAEYWHAAYYSVQPFFASMVGDLEVTDEVNEAVQRQATEARIWRRFHDNPHAFTGDNNG